jgi:RNase P subunit RPR2
LPSNHIPYNSVPCTTCHVVDFVAKVDTTTLHNNVSSVCKTCHDTSSPLYLGGMTRVTLGNHQRSTTAQDCTSCHSRSFTRWNSP